MNRIVCLTGLLGMVTFLGLSGQNPLRAEDWAQFRGPGGSGQSSAKGLPETWDDGQNLVWKTELPGAGTSSPIVVGDQIFLTSYNGYGLSQEMPGEMEQLRRQVVALNLKTGKIIWTDDVESGLSETPYQGFQALHGYASSTPVSDGRRLYVFFGQSGVMAWDLQGKKLWQAQVGDKIHNWGSATSPVLYKNLVIVNASVESGALVALNAENGQEVWRAEGMRRTWNTPILVNLQGGKTELVISVQGELLGFDPATGEQLWNCKGIDDYVCPSVIAQDGIVYAIGGRKNTALAVRAGGRGDVTETHKLWVAEKGSNVSSPVYHNGYLFWVNESRGAAYCLNAKTGEVVYEERIEPRPDRIYASPVAVDGKIYYVSREQGTFVLAAKPEFELLAHNRLSSDSSVFNGSPAVSDNRLLIRSDRYLYCLGNK